MGFDSISPYQRDPSSGQSHEHSSSGPSKAQPFSKDVLEALEKGDLDLAMAKMQEEAAKLEQKGIMLGVLLKLQQALKLTFIAPFQAMAKAIPKHEKKEIYQHKVSVEETKTSSTNSTLKALELMKAIPYLLTSIAQNIAEFGTASFRAMGQGILKALSPISRIYEALADKAGSLGQDLVKITETIKEKLKERLKIASDKMAKSLAKITTPLREWHENHLILKLQEIKKAIQHSWDAAVHKVNQMAAQAMQVMTIAMAPFALGFQMAIRMGNRVNGYGLKHITRLWKKTENWLSHHGGAFLKAMERVITPLTQKIYHFLEMLVDKLFRFLTWFWKKICQLAAKILPLLRQLAKNLMTACKNLLHLFRMMGHELIHRLKSFFVD